ncbi:hypothetical protein B0A48_04830 [Cryoendolithus antarcticus]|uniref:Uncharacterized protein n=1 Tax=Cryoendolithus antarcticus TaxID=1507870 RepID=A0A1V8TDZ2_9PEZI|nr:hypothetical protein B0A48_04830 [Cryoendolithus antarcticus]
MANTQDMDDLFDFSSFPDYDESTDIPSAADNSTSLPAEAGDDDVNPSKLNSSYLHTFKANAQTSTSPSSDEDALAAHQIKTHMTDNPARPGADTRGHGSSSLTRELHTQLPHIALTSTTIERRDTPAMPTSDGIALDNELHFSQTPSMIHGAISDAGCTFLGIVVRSQSAGTNSGAQMPSWVVDDTFNMQTKKRKREASTVNDHHSFEFGSLEAVRSGEDVISGGAGFANGEDFDVDSGKDCVDEGEHVEDGGKDLTDEEDYSDDDGEGFAVEDDDDYIADGTSARTPLTGTNHSHAQSQQIVIQPGSTSTAAGLPRGGSVASQSLASWGAMTMQASILPAPIAPPAHNATFPHVVINLGPTLNFVDATAVATIIEPLDFLGPDDLTIVRAQEGVYVQRIVTAFNAPWLVQMPWRKPTAALQAAWNSWQIDRCTWVSQHISWRAQTKPGFLQACATLVMHTIYEMHEPTPRNPTPGPRVIGSAAVNPGLKCSERVNATIRAISELGQVREDVVTPTRLHEMAADPASFAAKKCANKKNNLLKAT